MKKILLIAVGILFALGVILTFTELFDGITGNAVLDDYSYTRAFCEGRYCRDYEITCSRGEIVSKRLVEEGGVWHDEGWVDFRENESVC